MKKFFFIFFVWLLCCICVTAQLTAVSFAHGTSSDTNGPASETSLRNGQRAVIDTLVSVYNQAWLERSNANVYLQNLSANSDYHSDMLYQLNDYVQQGNGSLNIATNLLSRILTNSINSVYWQNASFLELETLSFQLELLQTQLVATASSTFTSARLSTNIFDVSRASTNILTGVSNVTAYAHNTAVGASNLLVSVVSLLGTLTNKMQIEINFDAAMSNSLYQINNAATWNQYIAENTKQATNFLSALLLQARTDTNFFGAQLMQARAQTNWNASQWSTQRQISTNGWRIDFGITNIVDRLDKLHLAALASSNLSQLSLAVLQSNLTVALQSAQTSDKMFRTISNSAAISLVNSNQISSANIRNANVAVLITNYLNDADANRFTASNSLSSTVSRHTIVPGDATEARPAGVFDLEFGGHTMNLDPLQHVQVGAAITVIRTFISWLVTFLLYAAIFRMVVLYLKDGAVSKTPQLGGLKLELWGFSVGDLSIPLYYVVLMIAIVALPTVAMAFLTTGAGLIPGGTVAVDFVSGLILNPFESFRPIAGVIYLLNGFLPLPLIVIAVVNYFFAYIVLAAIDFGTQATIRSMPN